MKAGALPVIEGVDCREGTCDLCRRKRKLYRFERYHWRCGVCYTVTDPDEVARIRAEGNERTKKRSLAARKAYPCVGGPLDGQHATTYDFERGHGKPGERYYREGGMYAHLANQYCEYNAASHSGPSMIFVHDTLLRQPISAKAR